MSDNSGKTTASAPPERARAENSRILRELAGMSPTVGLIWARAIFMRGTTDGHRWTRTPGAVDARGLGQAPAYGERGRSRARAVRRSRGAMKASGRLSAASEAVTVFSP